MALRGRRAARRARTGAGDATYQFPWEARYRVISRLFPPFVFVGNAPAPADIFQ